MINVSILQLFRWNVRLGGNKDQKALFQYSNCFGEIVRLDMPAPAGVYLFQYSNCFGEIFLGKSKSNTLSSFQYSNCFGEILGSLGKIAGYATFQYSNCFGEI